MNKIKILIGGMYIGWGECRLLVLIWMASMVLLNYWKDQQWDNEPRQWPAAALSMEPNFESTLDYLHSPYPMYIPPINILILFIYSQPVTPSQDSHLNTLTLLYKRPIFICDSQFCTWRRPSWSKRRTTAIIAPFATWMLIITVDHLKP